MNVLTATGTRVQVIPHRTHSALASGVVRLHAPGAMLDLPYREHVRRHAGARVAWRMNGPPGRYRLNRRCTCARRARNCLARSSGVTIVKPGM